MTSFLYPFLEGGERDRDGLLAELATTARAKAAASAALRATTLDDLRGELDATAAALAARLRDGGRLLTFGNGGSATDAANLADLFARPPHGAALAARNLAQDPAVLTALANDVGIDLVFSRQLAALGRPGDVALGLSTSGDSGNLLAAFGAARQRGMLTVGIAGYGGGRMAALALDHCLVVGSDSVHRIQETQAAIGHALWELVQRLLERHGVVDDV